jgi:hypothetical protein
MLGPADIKDWNYDERDMICAALRRHDSIHAVVSGADQSAIGFPDHLRGHVCRFAAQDDMAMDDLWMIAEWLGCFARRAA